MLSNRSVAYVCYVSCMYVHVCVSKHTKQILIVRPKPPKKIEEDRIENKKSYDCENRPNFVDLF